MTKARALASAICSGVLFILGVLYCPNITGWRLVVFDAFELLLLVSYGVSTAYYLHLMKEGKNEELN